VSVTPPAVVLVALVLVSHSRALAEGTAELVRQMAPAVTLLPAGGDSSGGLGTSFDAVESAIGVATADGRGAVVLTDLGSAVMTAESVLDLIDADVAGRVRIADAPIVEGAVAAAVAANGGADLATVLRAAEAAGAGFGKSGARGVVDDARAGAAPSAGGVLVRTVTLRNRLGLHARAAATLARLLSGFDARVTVDGVDAVSVLELMKLGVTGGQQLAVQVSGPQREEALAALVEAVEGGFGEV
jgi:PTS hybrid protein